MVGERIKEARDQIPDGISEPQMGPIATGLGEIYHFEVRAKPGYDYSIMDLRTILEWQVPYQLRSVPGVIEVNTHGGELKTYEVQVDPNKLLNYGISISQVFESLRQNNANEGGGYIAHQAEQQLVRGEALVESLDDIATIVLDDRADGTPIMIRDIGEVRLAPLLGNLRAGLIVAASIPLPALFMFIAMRLAGVPANLMSMGALDFGIIVDGSVVIVEQIVRRLSKSRDDPISSGPGLSTPDSRLSTIHDAGAEVGRPILFAGMVVIIVFLPVLSLQGIEGKMFRPMAFSFMSALVGTLILSVTVIPVMASLFLARKIRDKETWPVRVCKRSYGPVLRRAIAHPIPVTVTAIAVFSASLLIASQFGAEFWCSVTSAVATWPVLWPRPSKPSNNRSNCQPVTRSRGVGKSRTCKRPIDG